MLLLEVKLKTFSCQLTAGAGLKGVFVDCGGRSDESVILH